MAKVEERGISISVDESVQQLLLHLSDTERDLYFAFLASLRRDLEESIRQRLDPDLSKALKATVVSISPRLVALLRLESGRSGALEAIHIGDIVSRDFLAKHRAHGAR